MQDPFRHSAFCPLLLSIPLHTSASFLLMCRCFSSTQPSPPTLPPLLRCSLLLEPASTSFASFTCCSVFSLLSPGHMAPTFFQASSQEAPVMVAATCKTLSRWPLSSLWYSAPCLLSSSLCQATCTRHIGSRGIHVLPTLLSFTLEPFSGLKPREVQAAIVLLAGSPQHEG